MTFHSRLMPRQTDRRSRGGRAADLTAADVLRALGLVMTGQVFDLDLGRWPGMPLFATEPPFQVLSYRSPQGLMASGDFAAWTHATNGVVWSSDMVIGGSHVGTHIDALGHFSVNGTVASGRQQDAAAGVGDFGLLNDDASSIPPIVTRGVLIDVAGSQGCDVLQGGYVISRADCERALERQRVEVRSGDVVLIRTGYHRVWATPAQSSHYGAGIGIEVARWLADLGVVAIGSDTEGVEVTPAEDPGSPHPVHITCLAEEGIYLLEMVYVEELAAAGHYEFFFTCATARIAGATGAYARPLAMV